MILIITNKEDIHPDEVIEYFHKHNIPFFRLNTEAILTDYKVSFIRKGEIYKLLLTDVKRNVTIDSETITAVWERRPEKPRETNVKDDKIRELCLKEAAEAVFNIRHFLEDKFRIGDPIFDKVADSRMLQFKYATKAGFQTPDTIISNDFETSVDYISKDTRYLAQKSLSADSFDLSHEMDYYVFWTKKRALQDVLNYPKSSFDLTFNYLQEYVEKQYELRVTVVCNEVFACKIESQHLQEENGKIDFRQGYDHDLKYSIYFLPKDIEEKCIRYLRYMKLNFGCFDILVNKNNEHIFLECNSNGQWRWIEIEINLPIAKSIAKHLIKASW